MITVLPSTDGLILFKDLFIIIIIINNNKTNNRNNAPSLQNNSNCYTREPVELQAYESCYTTGEKRTKEQTTGTMPLAPKTIATATLEDQ